MTIPDPAVDHARQAGTACASAGPAASPRVTVIIPTYNWSSVLPYSVGSALGQTFRDLEVLVVGDGCTDDSEAVVEAIHDPRLRWMNLPGNTGHQSDPNNEGLRQARGELIAYLGHDDLWLPHHLALLVGALSGGADLVHSITELVHPDGNVQAYPTRFEFRPGMNIAPSSLVHRRTVTEAVGGWGRYTELREDPETDLWRRAHRAGYRFGFVPRLTVVKFPASWRRDAYRTRACHEQAAWSRRIREEPDFEAVELGRLLETAVHLSALKNVPLLDLLWGVAAQAVRRVRDSSSGRSPRVPGAKRGERIAAIRKFKGLGPGKMP
jgi:glycosyltransferase involved in cell wall biosynthesis